MCVYLVICLYMQIQLQDALNHIFGQMETEG